MCVWHAAFVCAVSTPTPHPPTHTNATAEGPPLLLAPPTLPHPAPPTHTYLHTPPPPTALSLVRRAIRAHPTRSQLITNTTAERKYLVTSKDLQTGAGGGARAGLGACSLKAAGHGVT